MKKKYSETYKQNACKLAKEIGPYKTAKALGVVPTMIYQWLAAQNANSAIAAEMENKSVSKKAVKTWLKQNESNYAVKYSEEFREAARKLAAEIGNYNAAKKLQVAPETIYRWQRAQALKASVEVLDGELAKLHVLLNTEPDNSAEELPSML